MAEHRLITAESVTEGHPDKLCDQIADAVLDDLLSQDPHSHVAVEVCAASGQFFVFGEVTSEGYSDISNIVRRTVRQVGYTHSSMGLDADSCGITISITNQSDEINQGVDRHVHGSTTEARYEAQGAGDQGVMFGYASDESDQLMPLPIAFAHALAFRLAQVRKEGIIPHLRPDGKTQVTFEYDEDHRPVRLHTVLISTQHDPGIKHDWLCEELRNLVVKPVCAQLLSDEIVQHNYRFLVNPTGSFVLGGPGADSGLTGRKIIVDTYGGAAHHGGGAFSGKDPSKVDRSAAYAARWVAKNIVAAGLAHTVEIQVAYAIGVSRPVSIDVETFDTEHDGLERSDIAAAVRDVFDLRPAAIIDQLDLLRPIYSKTAAYGHFGRVDVDLPWEKANKVALLRDSIERHTGIRLVSESKSDTAAGTCANAGTAANHSGVTANAGVVTPANTADGDADADHPLSSSNTTHA